jgi:vang-like
MDPFETAQTVFTSIARDLRRYLRVTRQQPFYTRDSIVAHLANCISYDMTPKAFLQRYLEAEPCVFNERALVNGAITAASATSGSTATINMPTTSVNEQPWILICDTPLYQNCEDNLMIVLKQNEVSLMCTFKRLPTFSLVEDILDPMRNKFII